MKQGEEDHLDVPNDIAPSAVAFMTPSISSLVQWHTRGLYKEELVIDGVPDGRVVLVYFLVMTVNV